MPTMIRKLAILVLLSTLAATAWAQNPRVAVKTSAGSFILELDSKAAPKTVANFLQYAKDGFYDGTIFHRVIDGFMIQGGGFDRDMRQKSTRPPIENETASALRAGLRNDLGTIAMARTSNPHSATAQFFINVKNNDFLNQGDGYTAFGRVVQGMEVVQRIAKAPTTTSGMHRDVPATPIVIESVSVLPAGGGKAGAK